MHRFGTAVLIMAACNGGKDTTDTGHDHDEMAAFSLRFAAVHDSATVDCTTPMSDLGPAGQHTVGLSDLRFYVSDLRLLDADGAEVVTTFDESEFQYTGASGWVGLIDLTSNSEGDCQATAISFSEGTARTNDAITGTTHLDDVASISFSVGVPQALMQEVIGANTPEAAPSPMNELFWSWASGYRHFVFNATVSDGVDQGEGYLHVGSTDCAGDGELALENRDACGFVNTPQVQLESFDLSADTVGVDLGAVLAGLDLVTPIRDPNTGDIIGQTPGFSCHSSPMQEHCPTVFSNFGIDIGTGVASAGSNAVFGRR